MPFIKPIVSFINKTLAAAPVISGGNTNRLHEVSTIIARQANPDARLELLPGILKENQSGALRNTEYLPLVPDDRDRLMVYHKVVSNVYSLDRDNSYGDGYRQKAVTDMSMVVWANLRQVSPVDAIDDIEPAFIVAMPFTLPKDLTGKLGIIKSTITVTGSIMDRLAVFRQEYPNTHFFLKPCQQFFLIKYRIETVYDKSCIKIKPGE